LGAEKRGSNTRVQVRGDSLSYTVQECDFLYGLMLDPCFIENICSILKGGIKNMQIAAGLWDLKKTGIEENLVISVFIGSSSVVFLFLVLALRFVDCVVRIPLHQLHQFIITCITRTCHLFTLITLFCSKRSEEFLTF
jgi:hypothetical protein